MANCKLLSVMIFMEIMFLVKHFLTTFSNMEDMAYVPYASVEIVVLMYVLACIRLNIAQAMTILN
jgi:hypothetical protein